MNNRAKTEPVLKVWQGVIALELDQQAKISRFTTVWDGALMSDSTLLKLLDTTIER